MTRHSSIKKVSAMQTTLFLTTAAAVFLAGPSMAQVATAGPIPVNGNVPALCAFGQTNAVIGSFEMGVLIDTTTGLLRGDLAAPDKVITGSFCNSRSSLNVTASRMAAQNFTGAVPANFSSAVDFTATATGWTPTAAAYQTGVVGAQTAATQNQPQPNAGAITLRVSTFATQGGVSLRPVADESYLGTVTLTLTPTS